MPDAAAAPFERAQGDEHDRGTDSLCIGEAR